MRNHSWMHAGIIAAILVVFGLGALGVTVPTAVIYLILLACPLMMVFMMFGMNHGDAPPQGSAGPKGGHASAVAPVAPVQQVRQRDTASPGGRRRTRPPTGARSR